MVDDTILRWLAIGLIVGLLARPMLRARDPGGIVVTALIGIAGALLAGFVARSLWPSPVGWIGQGAPIAGAILSLLLYRLILTRRT